MSKLLRLYRVLVTIPVLLIPLSPGIGAGQASPDDPMVEHAALPPPPEASEPTLRPEQPVIPVDSSPSHEPEPSPLSPGDLSGLEPAPASDAAASAGAEDPGPEYPIVANDRTRHFLGRYTGARRPVIELWFERAGRYLGMVRETLKRFGLPEDLAFTAMIESGFNPVAVSRAGAKGLWQFMAETARQYGLRVDRWVDERLDPEKSTIAAATYFRDLYAQFGSWSLAQAAYNTGETRLARAMQRARTTDFWVLARDGHLHEETRDFVPAIHALTLIGRNPDRYGFEVSLTDPLPYETMRVPASTDLTRLAGASGFSTGVLEELNPALLRGVTPPGGGYLLKIPPGTREAIRRVTGEKISEARAGGATKVTPKVAGVRVHVVRRNETVRGIAARYGVKVSDIRRWNSSLDMDRIHPGNRLRIARTVSPSAQTLAGISR